MRKESLLAAAAVAALGNAAFAVDFPELEPNDSKATATPVLLVAPGDTITGNSISATTTGLDYYRVTTPVQLPGIYRNRLTITTTGTAGHTGTLRGLSQVSAPADTLAGVPWDGVSGAPGTADNTAQTTSTASTPARFNQWYTFGAGASVYYRVTGGSTTTADYVATYSQDPVAAVDIGTYAPGLINFNSNAQGHTTDTEMWVYDGAFNAIPGYGNDDSSATLNGAPVATTSLQTYLTRNFAPGTYYLAVSQSNLANNFAAPSDDNFRTSSIMDFPGVLMSSSTGTNANMQFVITDSAGTTLTVQNTKAAHFDINFFRFTVVPEPTGLAMLALGVPVLFRRRRA